ncbi:hypothetical protein DFH06DRAFT_1020575, partial [Mycena polygramma]
AVFLQLAPRLWSAARNTIDDLVEHDPTLHLPLDHTNFGNPQPTAFSEVEYMFSTNAGTARCERDFVPGWRAITSVGNYDDAGGIILWADQTVVQFPLGATFFLPASVMPYSFTAVDETQWRRTITQSFDNGLHQYRANGFASEPLPAPKMTADEVEQRLRADAEAAVALYPTLSEYDLNYNRGLTLKYPPPRTTVASVVEA